ncbi:hypothetical protein EZS27_022214 [termite gut metagenome]|uniref:Transposase Synechocystis PCC 6803 domain-containing protein n=1 Tax=termite gut metagenome TaxID=433724 RepID=A0A5J4R6P1_9ZZZZ
MELTSKSRLPRLVKERIICEYLSGSKTIQMLSEEYGMSRNAINHMVSRHKSKFSPTFEAKPILPAMNRKKITGETTEKLFQENQALRHRLEQAQLKIESYEIMGDILQESYGIDLLKKSAAKQSPDSKNDTQR